MGFGDVVMASGVISEFKRRNPNAKIFLSTKNELVWWMMKDIDRYDRDKNFLMNICDESYDLDLVYENQPDVPVWVAYADFVFGEKNYDYKSILPQLDVIDFKSSTKFKLEQKYQVALPSQYFVIHPAYSTQSRAIEIEKWDSIVDFIIDKYKTPVVVIGNGADLEVMPRDGVINLKNRLNLIDTLGVIQNSSCFIGMDAGPMHLAMSTDIPVVGIFTIANPGYRVWRTKGTVCVMPNSTCKFCLETLPTPTLSVECKKLECIQSITVEAIKDAIDLGVLNATRFQS